MITVPVRADRLGQRTVPTMEFVITHKSGARIHEAALVDTGSAFLILSELLLANLGFPTGLAKRFKGGVEGISGRTDVWRLDDCSVALIDADGASHAVNSPVFFTRHSPLARPDHGR